MEQNNLKDFQNFDFSFDLEGENSAECKAVVSLESVKKDNASLQTVQSEASFSKAAESRLCFPKTVKNEAPSKNANNETDFPKAVQTEDFFSESVGNETNFSESGYDFEFAGKKIRYRKKTVSHILFMKAYLLFFFVGACLYASGKFGIGDIAKKIVGEIIIPAEGFSDFCLRFSPLAFGSFFVFASGFTIYAFLISIIYSVSSFFICGAVSCEIILQYGASAETLAVLVLIGFFCGECILFCSATRGISNIASEGISRLSIQDGVLYSILYISTVALNYYILMAVCFLLKT